MASKFVNRIRWAAYWFRDKNDPLNNDDAEEHDDNTHHRFPSKRSGPPSEHLERFEEDLFDIIKSIKFRRFDSDFQRRLNNDLANIRKSDKIFTSADKTGNIYKISKLDYDRMIKTEIHKDYKKAPKKAIDDINVEANDIIERNGIKGKVPKFEQVEAFVTVKDHKPGFPNTVKCRLLNPCKSHIGKISKTILDTINDEIRAKTQLTQWKNTQEVIQWFDALLNKDKLCFVKFDIVNFYPSITITNVLNALKFARKYIDVSVEDEEIILHSCKTLLIHDGEAWMKRGSANMFDVPMGSFFGAELCELIGLYILHNISSVFATGTYGLYRDDGLAVVRAKRACNLIKAETVIRNKMKDLGFSITIESGAVSTEFLDVTLNLRLNTFHPFKKPNSKTTYVHRHSNHPPHVTRAIPKMVQHRLCRLSKNKAAFDNHSSEYLNALQLSGYKTNDLSFKTLDMKKRRSRKRKVFYFHPPFCKSVRTNLGRVFRNLVERHFTPEHYLYKIFNKNTLKLSYSCLPNMKAKMAAHNKGILRKEAESTTEARSECNCRGTTCPMDGKCLTNNIVYKAIVSVPMDHKEDRVYIGSTSQTFKKRFYKHSASFKLENNDNSTTLSSFVHKLKRANIDYSIKWSIIYKAKQTTKNIGFCSLCNLEKLAIALAKKRTLLNSRNELIAKCRHNASLFF
jgi:hypothetical protein